MYSRLFLLFLPLFFFEHKDFQRGVETFHTTLTAVVVRWSMQARAVVCMHEPLKSRIYFVAKGELGRVRVLHGART